MLTNIAAFKHNGSFAGWLRQIMVNEALGYLRKHKKFTVELELNPQTNEFWEPVVWKVKEDSACKL